MVTVQRSFPLSGGNRKNPKQRKAKSRPSQPAKGKARGRQRGNRERREFAPVAVGFDSISSGLDNRGARSRRESNTEYVGEISGSDAFAATSYPINPGQSSLFPWLSQIAARFEKYRFHKLRFLYRTEKSSATNGTVMFAVDYDAADPLPANKAQLLQNEDKERKAPWQEFDLHCRGRNLIDTDGLFVRPGSKPGGTDIKTYDMGQLIVATQGMADTSAVGELWVDYDVSLMTPVLESSTAPVSTNVSLFQSNGAENVVSGVTYTMLLAVEPVNGLPAVNTAGTIVPPAGNYNVDCWVKVVAVTDISTISLDVQKNGATLEPASPSGFYGATGDLGEVLTTSNYVSCNGTDALTMKVTAGGTGGLTAYGSFRLTAV